MAQHHVKPSRSLTSRMCRWTLLVSGIGFGLCSFLFAPLFVRFASDIAYQDTWWVYLLYCLTDGGLLDIAVVLLAYPATLYAVWELGLRGAARVPISFALMTLAKYTVNFLFPALTYEGVLPSWSSFTRFDLPIMLANYALEMLQFGLVILCAVLVKRRYDRKQAEAYAYAELNEEETQEETEEEADRIFPFTRILSVKNPVQLSALLAAGVVFILRTAMHQIYQYTLYLNGGTEGILVMAMDLLADLFIAVILYFSVLLLTSRFHERGAEASEEQTE